MFSSFFGAGFKSSKKVTSNRALEIDSDHASPKQRPLYKEKRRKSVTFSPELQVYTIDRNPSVNDDASAPLMPPRSTDVDSATARASHSQKRSPQNVEPHIMPLKTVSKEPKNRIYPAMLSPVTPIKDTAATLGVQEIYYFSSRQRAPHLIYGLPPQSYAPIPTPTRRHILDVTASSSTSQNTTSSRRKHFSWDPQRVPYQIYSPSPQLSQHILPHSTPPTVPFYPDTAVHCHASYNYWDMPSGDQHGVSPSKRRYSHSPLPREYEYDKNGPSNAWYTSNGDNDGASPCKRRFSHSPQQLRVHERDADIPPIPSTKFSRSKDARYSLPATSISIYASPKEADNWAPLHDSVPTTTTPWRDHYISNDHHNALYSLPAVMPSSTAVSPCMKHRVYGSVISAVERQRISPALRIGYAQNNKGAGVFADKEIMPGEVLLKEQPFFIVPNLAPDQHYKDILFELELPIFHGVQELAGWNRARDMDGREFAALVCSHGVFVPLPDHSNSASESPDNATASDPHPALFRSLSLVNHSCGPNALFFWNAPSRTLSLVAVRAIRSGEELTVCYAGVPLGAPARVRQRAISSMYQFKCACAYCDANASARGDAARHALAGRFTKLTMDEWHRDARIADDVLIVRHRHALSLIEQEGLEAADDMAFEGWTGEPVNPELVGSPGHFQPTRNAPRSGSAKGSSGNAPLTSFFPDQANPHLHELSHLPREMTHHIDALAECYGALGDIEEFLAWTRRGIRARLIALSGSASPEAEEQNGQVGGSSGNILFKLTWQELWKFQGWEQNPMSFPDWDVRSKVKAAAAESLAPPYGSDRLPRVKGTR